MRTIEEFKELLQKAFEELEFGHNIVARQNFSCCQGCGCAEITDQKPDAIGYCFYHKQDNDDLIEHGSFHLAFGNDVGDEAAIPIGQKIVDVLNKHGITNEWNGTHNTRIEVITEAETRKV